MRVIFRRRDKCSFAVKFNFSGAFGFVWGFALIVLRRYIVAPSIKPHTLMTMQTPDVSLDLEPYIPNSWRQLQRQIENLAQFGGAVQVITGAEGAGKSTFLEDLLRQTSAEEGWEIWQVIDEAWPGQALQKLLEALGLPVGHEQSVGEAMMALRKFNQNLQRQRRRVVVAVDNADLLSDATLSGVVSVLQGGAEEGFGLHLVLFSRESLADRLDALQLIDVSVYDFVLPCLSLQELTELLNGEYQDLASREAVRPLSAESLQEIWLESQGLPGVALSMAREVWALSMVDESRFSLKGLPLVHIVLVIALLSLLVWALWMREKPAESTPQISQETSLQSISSKPLTIEMKQVSPGESASDPAPVPAQPASAQQTLANYTTSQNPDAQPAATPTPDSSVAANPASDPKPQVLDAKPVKSEVEPLKDVRAQEQKVTKPAETKTAEVKPAEPKSADSKPSEPKPSEPKPETKPADVKTLEQKPAAKLAAESTAAVKKPSESPVKANEERFSAADERAKMKQDKGAAAPTSVASSAKKLTTMNENKFVLQIMVTNSAKKVEDMLAAAPNRQDLAAYKTLRDGKEVYILVEGDYASANEAAAAAKNLPSMQQSAKPWPKKVGLIHAELKAP